MHSKHGGLRLYFFLAHTRSRLKLWIVKIWVAFVRVVTVRLRTKALGLLSGLQPLHNLLSEQDLRSNLLKALVEACPVIIMFTSRIDYWIRREE